MSDIDVSQLLGQMRSMAAAARSVPSAADQGSGSNEFAGLLQRAIEQVNNTQKTAANMATAYELGDANTNMAEVMVALQKANISFQAMLQVRNKLVSAYQEIMSMQL